MLLHRPNINKILGGLILCLCGAPLAAEQAIVPTDPAFKHADLAQAAIESAKPDGEAQVNAQNKAQAGIAAASPSHNSALEVPTGALTPAEGAAEAPAPTPAAVVAASSLPAPANSAVSSAGTQPVSADLALPAAPAVVSTADSATARPAKIEGGAEAPASLAAPLNPESLRRFNGQGEGAATTDLHPPGRFSTAEPLNPSAENLLKPDPAAPPPAPLAPATAFSLLGASLNPGTASRLAWSPEDSFSGIASPTPVLVVHGAKPGPRLCLTAAVHGDEVNGIEVVRNILYNLDPNQLAGTVIGVPIVNMQGFRRNSRYLADRRDLNRFFPGNSQGSAASRIASSLFNEVITSCQYLIDIHTGSMSRTNLPQLRADLSKPRVVELANLLGDIAVLQNKGTKGSLRRAAVDKNIAAVVIEAGEPYTFQEAAIEKSLRAIRHMLNQLKMYSYPDLSPGAPQYYKSQWLRAKAGGMLFSRINLGQAVKAGELLGVITDPITNQSSPIYSPKDAVILGMALNQVLHPGFAAYHLGIAANLADAQQSDAGPEDFGADAVQPDSQDNH